MTYLELVTLLVACLVWGDHWRGQRVQVMCDNMGVVGCVSRGWSGDARTMALLRHLLFAAARRDCTLEARFVPTKENGAADAVSRGELGRFRRSCPAAAVEPDPVPAGLTAYLSARKSCVTVTSDF